jgi:hypothetical protein
MKVEICVEGVNDIIRSELKETVKLLKLDLKNVKNRSGIAIFHVDRNKDIAEIKRHIEAFNIVLKYYGG